MKKSPVCSFIIPLVFTLLTSLSVFAENSAEENPLSLFETIATLDAELFAAFNQCSAPEQLQKHVSYFAEDVEFYHDTGGVTWSREEMLKNTRQYACGNYRRELLQDSFNVFPIKDFGAIAQGSHRFCQLANNSCDGIADFVMVWRHHNNKWQVTRVLSFGHRPAIAAENEQP